MDKAGLTNGTLKFVIVTGNPAEIVNTTTRATNITNGTRFTLSGTASTTFSRPEDGAWNPLNPREYYFVTTDQLDQVSDGLGAQIGQTRLWRLTFDDITNPDAGGKIDLLIDGRTVDRSEGQHVRQHHRQQDRPAICSFRKTWAARRTTARCGSTIPPRSRARPTRAR